MGTFAGQRTIFETIRFESSTIPVEIDFGRRKRLYLTVYPDQSVLVKVPVRTRLDAVLAYLTQHAQWIQQQREYFGSGRVHRLSRRYVSGEQLLYLGRRYRLKVIEGEDESVKLVGRFLRVVTSSSANTRRVRRLVEDWYQQRAEQIIGLRLEANEYMAHALGVEMPDVKIRRLKRSWGICTYRGHISLNYELVKTPRACIDYVIVHELCHLVQHDHSPDFYSLLTWCMPDWREHKTRLDRYLI